MEYLPGGIQMVAQGGIVANSLVDYLHRHPEIETRCSKHGRRAFFTTDSAEDFDRHAANFYGQVLESNHIDL
jgi:glutamate racemase